MTEHRFEYQGRTEEQVASQQRGFDCFLKYILAPTVVGLIVLGIADALIDMVRASLSRPGVVFMAVTVFIGLALALSYGCRRRT